MRSRFGPCTAHCSMTIMASPAAKFYYIKKRQRTWEPILIVAGVTPGGHGCDLYLENDGAAVHGGLAFGQPHWRSSTVRSWLPWRGSFSASFPCFPRSISAPICTFWCPYRCVPGKFLGPEVWGCAHRSVCHQPVYPTAPLAALRAFGWCSFGVCTQCRGLFCPAPAAFGGSKLVGRCCSCGWSM